APPVAATLALSGPWIQRVSHQQIVHAILDQDSKLRKTPFGGTWCRRRKKFSSSARASRLKPRGQFEPLKKREEPMSAEESDGFGDPALMVRLTSGL
ncbi:hypothetical protein SB658_22855, partial [Bacillus sp. SIMBA_008]|uniref:hypothetical protein n=1 Tax=Bacillus sp. SIMBA_008 TaxID=3085757 RepID=UPI00397A021B